MVQVPPFAILHNLSKTIGFEQVETMSNFHGHTYLHCEKKNYAGIAKAVTKKNFMGELHLIIPTSYKPSRGKYIHRNVVLPLSLFSINSSNSTSEM